MADAPIQADVTHRLTRDGAGETPQGRCNVRDRRVCQQCLACRALDKAEDLVLISEAHFGLGRVDVDIHLPWMELEEQGRHRIAADHQQGVIRLQECSCESHLVHPAAVDKKGDLTAVRARQGCRADETGQPVTIFLRQDLEHLAGRIDAVQSGENGAPVAVTGCLQGDIPAIR